MTRVSSATNIQNDDLICPITLGLFRDPVIAGDGRTYEREAITRWILEHGNSPFTREPLQINDLRPDDRLRRLAAQRRNSTVSFNTQNNIIILPPLRRVPRTTTTQVVPNQSFNLAGIIERCTKCSYLTICSFIVLTVIFVIIILRITLNTTTTNPSYTGFRLTTISISPISLPPSISSIYTSSLTNNSPVFIRLGASVGQFYYQAIRLIVPINGSYTFKSNSSIDMYGYLYGSYFNATNPNNSLLTQNNNSSGNGQFSFRILLQSNNYTLVATTSWPNVTGSFLIIATGPGNVTFQ